MSAIPGQAESPPPSQDQALFQAAALLRELWAASDIFSHIHRDMANAGAPDEPIDANDVAGWPEQIVFVTATLDRAGDSLRKALIDAGVELHGARA